ncbi:MULTISPECIES: polysaccharide biosynthesis/export family protein [Bacteroides]|uniref:Polysaccharide export protein n=1 Tax=Bacteroides zhangwenhongii TaxID=2650157 RepID=A0ABT5HAE1_9BACE|nr:MULTISPECIES: polysaccharide biosynthesis/export family protein [Bacteroides]MDC7137547.1 polysaccharide export protein [Bacteroides zhangwenhongii]OKZ21793.1 MAG: sugar transporter [Bacteroides finegoldii]
MKKINFGLLLFILLTGTSCISSKKMIYLQGVDSLTNPAQVIQQDYELRIKPDDQLYIMVSSKEPELLTPFANTQILGSSTSGGGTNIQETTGVQVDKNGKIDVPILGEIQVAGLTRLQLADEIKKRLEEGQYIKDPTVSVRIKGLKISVMGEVGSPGVHEMAGDRITLLEALSMAGDLTPTAKRTNILVLREEEGKRHTYTVDLTSGRDVLESPCYYLQQNDVVYVEPNKSINVKGSSALSYLGAGASIISVLASIVSLIVVLSK